MHRPKKATAARLFLLFAGFALAAPAGPAGAQRGGLTALPGAAPAPAQRPAPGLLRLADGALAYLPASADRDRPLPLLLLLPGTGGVAREMIDALRGAAERHGILLLAVRPRGENWDAVDTFFDAYEAGSEAGRSRWPVPRFGADARRIDAALADLFARLPVDPARIGVLGFSHGASYALALGAANPRLFSTIIALSPGILVLPEAPAGGQHVYVSHGTRDPIQPFRRTRFSFVPRLLALGFRVTFRPFEGGHALPDATVEESVRLFACPAPCPSPAR
jgi:phospholipase/carboxylesterase